MYPIFDKDRCNMAVKSRDKFGELTGAGRIGSDHLSVEKDFPHAITLEELCHQFYFSNITKNYRAICFSKNPVQTVMWSLYADHHKGMVIGFDTNAPSFPQGVRPGGFEVDYLPTREEMCLPLHAYYFKALRDGEAILRAFPSGYVENGGLLVLNDELERQYHEATINMLFKKHDIWKDEQEHRFIYDLRRETQPGLKRVATKGKDGVDVLRDVVQLNDSAVAEIWVGRYFPVEQAKGLFNLLQGGAYSGSKLFWTSLSKTEFKLDFEEVDKLQMSNRYELDTPGLWRGRSR
ncbi:MAG: DUF2971 domain-containing protein [Verrucomicrobiaceae bacterium]|nr:DUF2971 domain-containing protein [Verrucomicrobiaceae bacterium]